MSEITCPRCGSVSVSRHGTPIRAEGEADVWAPVLDEGYLCSTCELLESCQNNEDGYVAFRNRWNDPIKRQSPAEYQAWLDRMDRMDDEQARAWSWPLESEHGIHDRAWRAEQLAERARSEKYELTSVVDGHLEFAYVDPLPVNDELIAEILAHPDDTSARARLAIWLRHQSHPMAGTAADFIEGQLFLAESFAKDPRADVKASLPVHAFARREAQATDIADRTWWRFAADPDVMRAMFDSTYVLEHVGLIADLQYFRGFVEHVAIKASRFLEIADELYSLAPIRQLTITYCKGRDHDDPGLLKALLDSPHLERIRALKLPVRKFGRDKGDVTELNRLTDDDIELLAGSQHLRGLRCLDLQDQKRLTVRAFDALAASPNLPELSAVRHDINRYWYPGSFSFGTVGKQQRALADRPLHAYAPELEARHGHIPWLHVAENYGSESPDVEAAIEHPVARRTGT